jgi:AcrR family transcriptional regulator
MQAFSKALFVAAPRPPGYRTRLVEGMLSALAEKGYLEVSVMDIVRHAKVSKRTFYEHFADKEGCFLDAYAAVSDELLARIARAAVGADTAEQKLARAVEIYFGTLQEERWLLRAFLSEIHAAGPRALALRRKILQRFAELVRSIVHEARAQEPELRELSPEMATVIIGGIHELILSTLEQGYVEGLTKVGATTYQLIRAVLAPDPASLEDLPAPARAAAK